MNDRAKYLYSLKENHNLYGRAGYRIDGDQYDVIPKQHQNLFELYDPRKRNTLSDSIMESISIPNIESSILYMDDPEEDFESDYDPDEDDF